MLRKPFHGWRIKQEIQKLTAIRTPSPNLNPVRESPRKPTRPTPLASLSPLPSTSHFRFTHQSLSTSSLATGPSSAAYCSRAPELHLNTHLEDPNLNVESLRESSDERRENSGDGEGFRRGRTLREEYVLFFTCVSKDGEGPAFCFRTKRNCQVDNKPEVYPRDVYDVLMERLKKHQAIAPKKRVAHKLEVLGRRFRVAYEEAMQYGVRVMMNRHFPVQVALCDSRPLSKKIEFVRASILYHKSFLRGGHSKERFSRARSSRLWRLCVLQLLQCIQSGTYFGRKK